MDQQEDGQSAESTSWPARPAPDDAREANPAELEHERHRAFLAEPDPVGLYSPAAEASTQTLTALRRRDSLPARRLRLVGLIVLGVTLSGLGVANYLGAGHIVCGAPGVHRALLEIVGRYPALVAPRVAKAA